MSTPNLDTLSINTIRTLSMDAVQQANSGHPGTPMAMAPVAYALWQRHLRFDPDDPDLAGPRPLRALDGPRLDAALFDAAPDRREGREPEVRDAWASCRCRSTTSSASASSTAAARAIPSTAGRRASRPRPARSARAWRPASAWRSPAKWLAAHFNRPGFPMFGFDVYALAGDGCLMEGISGEAASLAGHLQLDNLVLDLRQQPHHDRRATRDLAFSEDVATRFIGYGWNVTRVGDANDLAMLDRAFETFKKTTGRPTLIIVDSHIGYGAPTKQDTHAAHGEPLGEEEIKAAPSGSTAGRRTRSSSCPTACASTSPRASARAAAKLRADWMRAASRPTRRSIPQEADALYRMQHRQLPDGWEKAIPTFPADAKGLAGRDASAKVLNAVAQNDSVAHRRLGRPGALDQDAPDLRRRRRLRGGLVRAAATSISASASTPWARSSTACRCRRSGPTARAS